MLSRCREWARVRQGRRIATRAEVQAIRALRPQLPFAAASTAITNAVAEIGTRISQAPEERFLGSGVIRHTFPNTDAVAVPVDGEAPHP